MNLIPWKAKGNVRVSREDAPIMAQFRSDLNQLFDHWLREPGRILEEKIFPETATWLPVVDVTETDRKIVVTAEMPGLESKDVDITVSDGILTIKAEKQDERSEKKDEYCYSERRYGCTTRSIEPPAYADVEHVEASMKHGVLTIQVAKQPAKVPQKIEVKGTTPPVRQLVQSN